MNESYRKLMNENYLKLICKWRLIKAAKTISETGILWNLVCFIKSVDSDINIRTSEWPKCL